MIYSWQTVNEGNLAEQVCRPTDYVDLGQPVTILDQCCPESDLHQGPLIFGASGLLYPEISPILERAVKTKRHPMIVWGIGHNTHYGTDITYPDWLDRFDLIGLRDHNTRWPYVPCPSCLNPAFDRMYPDPEHELVIYDQFDYPVKARYEGVPRESNMHHGSEMLRIVSFLASGKTILTSSYHGAYWGMLLGRKVVLWNPWSTKFRTFFRMPPVINNEIWPLPEGETGGDGYFRDCRSLNAEFATRISRLLNPSGTCNSTQAGVKLRL